MEQARLIQRLKEMLDIKIGLPIQIIENNSDKMSEVTLMAGVTNERQARRLNRLNALIPPLQALSSSSGLFVRHSDSSAVWIVCRGYGYRSAPTMLTPHRDWRPILGQRCGDAVAGAEVVGVSDTPLSWMAGFFRVAKTQKHERSAIIANRSGRCLDHEESYAMFRDQGAPNDAGWWYIVVSGDTTKSRANPWLDGGIHTRVVATMS